MPIHRLLLATLATLYGFTAASLPSLGIAGEPQLLEKSNLVAWCIVPFDAKKRGPAERAEMLKELGISKCAYDWRKEHVDTFEQEILEYRKHGIEFFAFWSQHPSAFELFKKYDLHPQVWQTLGDPGGEAATKVARAADTMQELAARTAELDCEFGLYNHGGWGGKPENLIAVCRELRRRGFAHVGIVYNFHHAHDERDEWPGALQKMLPYLLCININGMHSSPNPKIETLGEGEHELAMISEILASDYEGPIGVLDHRNELDAKESLRLNLDGLDRLKQKLQSASKSSSTP